VIGISSACYYPMQTEDALAQIADSGARVCEIFFNTQSEIAHPFIDRIKKIADDGGFSVGSVHPFSSFAETNCFFSAYGRRTEESIDWYKGFFSGAAELGAKFFVFHGAVYSASLSPEFYAERFSLLSRAAKTEGITLCQENVSRCLAGKSSYVAELRRLLGDEISFVLDVKQAHRAGEDPFKMAEAMGGGLKLVHVNDFDAHRECLLPGEGAFDLTGFKKALDGAGFCENYIIEVYRDNYGDYSEVKSSYRRLSEAFYPQK